MAEAPLDPFSEVVDERRRWTPDWYSWLVRFVVDLNSAIASKVTGPASSTDNAIARFDGTTGKLIQDSGITISDANIVSNPSGTIRFDQSARFIFAGIGGTTQPLYDFIDNNVWAGSGGVQRFFGLDDALGGPHLGAVINGGFAVKTAGALKGDIDFIVFDGTNVLAGAALTGVAPAGFKPINDNAYVNGDASHRWLSFNSTTARIHGFFDVNANAGTVTPTTGTLVQIVNADESSSMVEMTGIGTAAGIQIQGRRARGTAGSLSAVQANDQLLAFAGIGAETGAFGAATKARFTINAGENWSSGNNGTYIQIATTPNGSTTRTDSVRFFGSGGVSIGNTTDPGIGSLKLNNSFQRAAPVTETGTTHSVATTTTHLITNNAAAVTVTLPAAASFVGREIYIKTITTGTVVSDASNVVPSTSATAGTAILPATDGAWAFLVSDGTNWIIMAANPLV